MAEKFLVPIYLPRWLHDPIRTIKRALIPPAPAQPADQIPSIDLSGDRDIEWSYIASRLPVGNGLVLDFGSGWGTMSMHAIQKGHKVVAVDLEDNTFPWWHQNLTRVQGDLLEADLPEAAFDYVLNCSTVEHVGLTGRYGIAVAESNGDLAAMRKLRKLLKSSGTMLMTVPCGQDAVVVPWHRVYGENRLPLLLDGYTVEEEEYWVKQADNRWRECTREVALAYRPTGHATVAGKCTYALGCFAVRPAGIRRLDNADALHNG